MTCCGMGIGQQFSYIPPLLPVLHRGLQKENTSETGKLVGSRLGKRTPPLILTELGFTLLLENSHCPT